MSRKTWSIMSAGTVVSASFDEGTDLQCIIEENNVGTISNSRNSEELKNAILKLYNNINPCMEYGTIGRRFIESNFMSEVCVTKYLKVILTI